MEGVEGGAGGRGLPAGGAGGEAVGEGRNGGHQGGGRGRGEFGTGRRRGRFPRALLLPAGVATAHAHVIPLTGRRGHERAGSAATRLGVHTGAPGRRRCHHRHRRGQGRRQKEPGGGQGHCGPQGASSKGTGRGVKSGHRNDCNTPRRPIFQLPPRGHRCWWSCSTVDPVPGHARPELGPEIVVKPHYGYPPLTSDQVHPSSTTSSPNRRRRSASCVTACRKGSSAATGRPAAVNGERSGIPTFGS